VNMMSKATDISFGSPLVALFGCRTQPLDEGG
jgi:hypothetical protein